MRRLCPGVVLMLTAFVAGGCESSDPTAPDNGDVAGLTISGTATAGIGGTTQLQAVAIMTNGTPQTVTEAARWTSNAPTVASVSDGLVSGFTAGEALVLAEYGGRTAQVVVSVSGNPAPGGAVTELTIAGDPRLAVAQTTQLEAVARLTDGTTRTVTADATWNSTASQVAAVTGGRVTGVADGEALITAEFGGRTAQLSVTVGGSTLPVTSLSMTGDTALVIGQNSQLQVVAQMADGSSQTVTDQATWRSSDSAVATVTGGRVSGMAPGSTTITATYGGRTTQLTVNVAGTD